MGQIIGVRREDKNRWERRAPLGPSHVRDLVGRGVRIVVQPSSSRVFSDGDYSRSGAILSEDLSRCGLVLGVKEMPPEQFRKRGAYLFFSHVTKGQPYNMRMLRRILDCEATLLDYEHVVDDTRRRKIFFGNHAGAVGMIETLYALGRRLEWEGRTTPLSMLVRPLDLSGLEDGRQLLLEVGRRIARDGVGPALAPVVVGFAGYGNVSVGAQEFFNLLPHDQLEPAALERFVTAGNWSDRKLYKVVFKEQDMMVPRRSGAGFDLTEYYAHPERYRAGFERYLAHLDVLMNCIYWERRYPRLVSKAWLRSAWKNPTRPRLRVIGDITCDIEGAVECTLEAREPGEPTYTYLPLSDTIVDGWRGDGVVVMAVDTLPSEVPREASLSFGDMLTPFVEDLANVDLSVDFNALALRPILKRSVIVYRGELTPRYRHLEAHL